MEETRHREDREVSDAGTNSATYTEWHLLMNLLKTEGVRKSNKHVTLRRQEQARSDEIRVGQ